MTPPIRRRKKELADATAALSKTYANAKAEAAQAKSDVGATDWNVDGTNDVGKVDSVGSVGKIDSDVNIADEDLKFLRDVAEMRYVQNFVTLTPTVAVEAQISERSTSTKSSNESKASWKTNSQRRRKEYITNEQLPNDTDRRWTGNQHSRPSGETERVFAWEKNERVTVLDLGEVLLLRKKGLRILSWESFFPADSAPYTTGQVRDPISIIQAIQKARDSKTPVRFLITGTDLDCNIRMGIESFEYEERSGELGDLYYTIKLYEWKDTSPKKNCPSGKEEHTGENPGTGQSRKA